MIGYQQQLQFTSFIVTKSEEKIVFSNVIEFGNVIELNIA